MLPSHKNFDIYDENHKKNVSLPLITQTGEYNFKVMHQIVSVGPHIKELYLKINMTA